MSESKCKGCGATIIWAVNPATGKKVPIHKVKVYRLVETPDGMECIPEDDEDLGINHFIDCPKANNFNRSAK